MNKKFIAHGTTTSKIIKDNIITLLNNLYKSLSNLMPKNIECIVRATSEMLVYKKYLFYMLVCLS